MTKTFKDVKGIEEACWVGYKQVGMKKKGNRQVPNCVKEEIVYAVFGKVSFLTCLKKLDHLVF